MASEGYGGSQMKPSNQIKQSGWRAWRQTIHATNCGVSAVGSIHEFVRDECMAWRIFMAVRVIAFRIVASCVRSEWRSSQSVAFTRFTRVGQERKRETHTHKSGHKSVYDNVLKFPKCRR